MHSESGSDITENPLGIFFFFLEYLYYGDNYGDNELPKAGDILLPFLNSVSGHGPCL